MGELRDPEEGKALQNFMICVEMLLAGAAMRFAFPHAQYCIGGSAAGFRLDAFAHAASINDVVKDVIHVFAPSYSDYVLYTDGGPADHVKRKKFRGQGGGALEAPRRNLIKAAARAGLEAVDDVIDAAGGAACRGGGGGGARRSHRRAKGEARAMERNRWGALCGVYMYVSACVRACVRGCVCVHVHACVCVCVSPEPP